MGIVFKERGPLERVGNEVEAFADGVLDDIIFRGVAKIAFNFLAHLKGADFVLRIVTTRSIGKRMDTSSCLIGTRCKKESFVWCPCSII